MEDTSLFNLDTRYDLIHLRSNSIPLMDGQVIQDLKAPRRCPGQSHDAGFSVV
ncbi:hypothetical protein J6590_068357 [Homalodisca vitripennis]|nr:hypothetical protein J6590_068357 [Homalodisca vitripennis]